MRHLLATCAATVLVASPALAEPINIGVSMALFDDNFLTSVREAMAKQAEAMPDVQIQFEDAQADIGRQLSQVQNFVAQGVDAIIVNPADTAATKPITEAASGAGIPLVYVNRKPEEATLPEKVAFVGSDELEAGRLQMEALAKCMGDKGNLAIMLGELASNGTQGRTAGVKQVLEQHPDIQIVEEQTANFQRNQAIDLMTNWVVGGTEINAVAANNDEMAIGAILAMQQAGISPEDVCVGGVDATADALAAMQQGTLDVTVFQDAQGQGQRAVDAVVKLARGEQVDQVNWIPFQLVTPDNLQSFVKQ
jgi:inositol transport system substrate-binding protein